MNQSEMQLAGFRERLAALVLDLFTCSVTAWMAATLLGSRQGVISSLWRWINTNADAQRITVGIVAAGALFYFFLLEWVFGATTGKLACGLRVRTLEDSRCGFVPALVRTVFRPIDLLCGLVLMVTSRYTQRLGDRIAGTVVTKRRPERLEDYYKHERASWEERTKAAIVDLTLLTIFAIVYLFGTGFLDKGHFQLELRSWTLLPLLQMLFLYFVILEGLFDATVGKLVCKLRIVGADRRRCGFASATIRTLQYPLNLMSMGLLPLLLIMTTSNGQHLGDLLAGTIVVKDDGTCPDPQVSEAGLNRRLDVESRAFD